jgi:RNA polymerase sigma-70 factor, ECF subfamily
VSETSVSLLNRLRLHPEAAAWQRLVLLYTPLLQGWLRRYCLQPSDVDDLVQEVLAVLVRELPQFQHNGRSGAFRCWLRTILVHRLRKFWQRRQADPVVSGGSNFLQALDAWEDPTSDLSRHWDREHDEHVSRRLLELIQPEFTPSTWRAFQGVVLEGKSAQAVAADLGISVNAVFIAKSRVLARLREEGQGLLE